MFDRLRLSFNEVSTAFMCKICVKYRYASRAVCANAHAFRKRPWCALIGAYSLIRTNTVIENPCRYIKIEITGLIFDHEEADTRLLLANKLLLVVQPPCTDSLIYCSLFLSADCNGLWFYSGIYGKVKRRK